MNITYSIKYFFLSFHIKFRCNTLFSPIFDNLVEPIILAGNSNQRQCYKNLPLNFKNQSKMLLIALLLKTDCTFFCALSKLTRVDPTKIGHIQRNTFSQLFGLLFCYDQTVEMPVQQFILTRFFLHFFTDLSFALVQIHHFITFSMFFHKSFEIWTRNQVLLFWR